MYGSYYETDDSNSTPSNITDMRFLDVGVSLLDQDKHRKHSISVQEESWQIYSAIQILEIRSIHGSSATTGLALDLDGQPAILWVNLPSFCKDHEVPVKNSGASMIVGFPWDLDGFGWIWRLLESLCGSLAC